MNLMVVNGNALAITDLDFNEILCRIYFTRDVTTKLKEKIRQHNIREDERSKREQAASKLRSISHDNSNIINNDMDKVKYDFDILKYAGLQSHRSALRSRQVNKKTSVLDNHTRASIDSPVSGA